MYAVPVRVMIISLVVTVHFITNVVKTHIPYLVVFREFNSIIQYATNTFQIGRNMVAKRQYWKCRILGRTNAKLPYLLSNFES